MNTKGEREVVTTKVGYLPPKILIDSEEDDTVKYLGTTEYRY